MSIHEIYPNRCPYADECGYQGVFLYEDGFREDMEKFHPGKIFKQ
jgi:hypothetical protein